MLGTTRRPDGVDHEQWATLSTSEQVATTSPNAPHFLSCRAVIGRKQIWVRPEGGRYPAFDLPNNVGARGFSPGGTFHKYLVPVLAPPSLRGPAGLVAVGAALHVNPTPGRDEPASSEGAVNDVGWLIPFIDLDFNFVRSFWIESSNPRRSGAVVNYTINQNHTMNEGFVIRFAELRTDDRIELITYGEGNSWKMRPFLRGIWEPQVRNAWIKVANETFKFAQRYRP